MATHTQSANGLEFSRRYTRDDINVFEQFEYDYRTSVIRNPSGEIVFEMTNVEVPKGWSQIATDILAQKYFRKAGVPITIFSEKRPPLRIAGSMLSKWFVVPIRKTL